MPTFDIVTIFPAMIEQSLAAGIIGRAVASRLIDVKIRDLRDFTTDRHRVVDDVPYGGGPGMVLKPDPIFRALDAIEAERGRPLAVVLTSPQGRRFTQTEAQRLSGLAHLVLLCGRYEGFDDRVRERVTEELSIGDYVLTGGEWPALVVVDAVARLVPGVVGDEQSVADDSFSRGLVGFPQFTRPAADGGVRGARARSSPFRSPPGRRRSATCGCPTSCCRATTRKSGAGGSGRRWNGRSNGGRGLLPAAGLDEKQKKDGEE